MKTEWMRLDKCLGALGVDTRKNLGKRIRGGSVTVNGEVIKDPGYKIQPALCEILVDGTKVSYEKERYYIMNKPEGVVTATKDRDKTVLDLVAEGERKDLIPVGRLDKDTRGLLILTTDGAFTHHLLSPRHHVEKEYEAILSGPLDPEDVEAFAKGLVLLDGTKCLPAKLVLDAQEENRVFITIQEGKYHQVKRMVETRGKKVCQLKRIRMGGLILDPSLLPGTYRPLTQEEMRKLRNEDFNGEKGSTL